MTRLSRDEQSAWMHSLRAQTARVEFVFNNGDEGHPVLESLAHLNAVRTIGVAAGNGYYGRGRPKAVKRSYAGDRDIIFAIDSLGCFWPDAGSPEQWTELGDVDVVFLDAKGRLLGATVTHERLIITPEHEAEATLRGVSGKLG